MRYGNLINIFIQQYIKLTQGSESQHDPSLPIRGEDNQGTIICHFKDLRDNNFQSLFVLPLKLSFENKNILNLLKEKKSKDCKPTGLVHISTNTFHEKYMISKRYSEVQKKWLIM